MRLLLILRLNLSLNKGIKTLVSVAVPPAPVRVPSRRPLAPSVANDKGDNKMITAPRIISLSPLSLATDMTDVTLEPSGNWLGTRTGAGGTTTPV